MKKIYWLALWWGSARWLVHIWVIKYLEEKNIKIWEIAWTSMWALVWALYSIWKKSDDLISIAKDLDYMKLIDFDLRYGFIKWEKIRKKIELYFWDMNIEELPIKMKIIATNIETWEIKIFEKWNLVDALRASISIPWVFKPYKIWNEFFIDWLVVKNLPVDEISLKNKIWVSASKLPIWPLSSKREFLWIQFKKWFLNLNYQIIQRTIINMMIQNEKMSISKSSWNVQILDFDFWNLDFLSFWEVDKFVEIWYNTAKKNLKF